MRRKLVALLMVVAFSFSAALTATVLAKPKCQKCVKDGCPPGYCYVDCVGCCYEDPRYPFPVCFG